MKVKVEILEKTFQKIKENSLKTNNYKQFLVVMQKMLLMSEHKQSSEIWFLYEDFCKNFINFDDGFLNYFLI